MTKLVAWFQFKKLRWLSITYARMVQKYFHQNPNHITGIKNNLSKLWKNYSKNFLFSRFSLNGIKICKTKLHTVVFNMLTNVAKVWVNENIKEIKRKLCSFMLFGRILCFLLKQWRKSLKIVVMFPEISLKFSFC